MFVKGFAVSAAGTVSRPRLGGFVMALALSAVGFNVVAIAQTAQHISTAKDPGVRGGPAGAGSPIAGLNAYEMAFFSAGQENFALLDSVSGALAGTGSGLGPRYNAESCAQCHAHPAIGGSSPAVNPQVATANDEGATNQIPPFITANGPVREARFPYSMDLRSVDGGVHALFTITGRTDAAGCNLTQPDFALAAARNNLVFRIPTPAFGGGLIEAITDGAIRANQQNNLSQKRALGIGGRPNISGNDGSISRFGWKAQNNSLEMFSGEAYNVEVGATNELFASERDQTPGCQFNATPEDHMNYGMDGTAQPSDVMRFTVFMRMLDQPQPGPRSNSTQHGNQLFAQVGCALCHTASMTTSNSSVAALSNVKANLYSDLLLHHMGPALADNIVQGTAGGDEFRTAPLWGLGQRLFFLHDGRTSDLVRAIQMHASPGNGSYRGSEANAVVNGYNRLPPTEQQDLLNFLRSL